MPRSQQVRDYTVKCGNPACPTLVEAVEDNLIDNVTELVQDRKGGLSAAIIEHQEACDELRRLAALGKDSGFYVEQAQQRRAKTLETLSGLLDGVLDLSIYKDEREDAHGAYDPGRTSGDPYNCYPPEVVEEPVCGVCGSDEVLEDA